MDNPYAIKVFVTTDIVILTIKDSQLKVLLTKRTIDPYKDTYTLPGGFIFEDKSLNDSAKEILKRDTGISNIYLEQLFSFGLPKRDPRSRTITVSYFALIDSEQLKLEAFKEKSNEVNWFALFEIKKLKLGFDHRKIINTAIERIQNKTEYSNIAFQLLPKKFTLAELQEVYEIILEKQLDKRNFRKKIAELDMLKELNEFKKEGRMRPAKYYSFKENSQESVFKAKRWV